MSANPWIGAFLAWASSTKFIIFAIAVSEPIFCTSKIIVDSKFKLPDGSSTPGDASNGKDSPVRLEISTAELPFTTKPSTGILSPANNWIFSPGLRAPILISRVWLLSKTRLAMSGCNLANSFNAVPVFTRALSSKKRPNKTKILV